MPARKVTDVTPFELKCMQRTRALVMPSDAEIEAGLFLTCDSPDRASAYLFETA